MIVFLFLEHVFFSILSLSVEILFCALFSFFLIVILELWFFFSYFNVNLVFPELVEGGLVHIDVLISQSSTFCHFQVVFISLVACFLRFPGLLLFGLSHSFVSLVSILLRFDFVPWSLSSVWGLSWKGALSSWFLDYWNPHCSSFFRPFYFWPLQSPVGEG